ncbi:MAG: hypothetical protein ABI165_05400 [Bryobacteraceae bacterium]
MDPLHFTIAVEPACSVSCDEAHYFSFTHYNEVRTALQSLLKRVFTV